MGLEGTGRARLCGRVRHWEWTGTMTGWGDGAGARRDPPGEQRGPVRTPGGCSDVMTLPRGGVTGPGGGTPGSGGPALAVQGQGHARPAPSRQRRWGGGCPRLPPPSHPCSPQAGGRDAEAGGCGEEPGAVSQGEGVGGGLSPLCSARAVPVPPSHPVQHAGAAPAPTAPACEDPGDTL